MDHLDAFLHTGSEDNRFAVNGFESEDWLQSGQGSFQSRRA